jgi:hypothetical protein
MAKLKIGDRVRLTGKFLKSTGQQTGSAGLDKWTIVGFWSDGRMALVNEPIDQSGYMDLPPDQRPKWRSIAVGNLQKIGTLTADLKRAKRSKPRRRTTKRSAVARRHRARRARTKLRKRLTRRRRTMSLPKASEYHESHINSALLQKLHAIRAKSDAFYKSRNTAKPAFMNYGISKPAAAKFAEMAGVKKPRPGYQVDIANDASANVTWVLINQSGSFSVNARYR